MNLFLKIINLLSQQLLWDVHCVRSPVFNHRVHSDDHGEISRLLHSPQIQTCSLEIVEATAEEHFQVLLLSILQVRVPIEQVVQPIVLLACLAISHGCRTHWSSSHWCHSHGRTIELHLVVSTGSVSRCGSTTPETCDTGLAHLTLVAHLPEDLGLLWREGQVVGPRSKVLQDQSVRFDHVEQILWRFDALCLHLRLLIKGHSALVLPVVEEVVPEQFLLSLDSLVLLPHLADFQLQLLDVALRHLLQVEFKNFHLQLQLIRIIHLSARVLIFGNPPV